MRGGERVVLLHIRDALRLVLEYSRDGREAFLEDRRTQDAVLRRLGIVGEAAKRLDPQFRDRHAEIPWRRLAGFRDVTIHQYDRVDPEIVWRLVEREVEPLLHQIEALLQQSGESR